MLHIPITIGGKEMFIRSDKLNYILSEPQSYVSSKTGETINSYDDHWFYGTLEGLFSGIFELKLKNTDATSIAELHAEVVKIKNYLLGYVSDHKEELMQEFKKDYR